MMRKTKFPNEKTYTLSIDSFQKGINTSLNPKTTNLNYARDIQNFSFKDGSLQNGLGFSCLIEKLAKNNEYESLMRDIETIGSIEKVFYFYIYNQETGAKEDKLIFLNSELDMFYINLYDTTKNINSLKNINFTSMPVAVNYRLNGEDVIIFSSETNNMIVWNGHDLPYEVLDAPKISSMAMHYERLFATVDGEKNAVWFSDDLDPTNWSLNLNEAGFIELIDERGALLKVVSFCDYLYIFRKNGISRLSAYGNQENFAVSNLFVSSGEIFASSVCVCGDKIVFLASDGLYRFDGINTVKILENISENLSGIDNKNACACYLDGSYYLACKYNFYSDIDDCKNLYYSNCLLEIDIDSFEIKNISHGINIKYLSAINSDVFKGVIALANDDKLKEYSLTFLDRSASFLGVPLNKVWISNISGIDNLYNQKTLKKIYTHGKGKFILTIIADDKEYSFEMDKNFNKKRVNIPFSNFAFKIQSSNACEIYNLKFEISSSNGRI